MRSAVVWVHRWVGLALAVVLVIEGVTGSLLAYRADLTRLLGGAALDAGTAPTLDLGSLADRADEQLAPHAAVAYFFAPADGQVLMRLRALPDPATGLPYPLAQAHQAFDAATGTMMPARGPATGRASWLPEVMPFVYDLHTMLAIGDAGRWVLGIAALLWTLDCLWALLLTLPTGLRGFWRRWRLAWRVRWRGGGTRVDFDLHRAGSLWSWIPLLVFAWSSVLLTLPSVYEPVTRAVFDYAGYEEFDRGLPQRHRDRPGLGWRAAQRAADALVADLAAREHFAVTGAAAMAYFPDNDLYSYTVRTTRRFPQPAEYGIYVDAENGRLLRIERFSGEHAGNTVSNWLYALHLARDPVDAPVYRLIVCAMGLLTVLITVTGLVIWWKKLTARRWSRRRVSSRAA